MVPTDQEAGWASELIWTQRLEEKILSFCWGSNPGHPVCFQTLQWLSHLGSPTPYKWVWEIILKPPMSYSSVHICCRNQLLLLTKYSLFKKRDNQFAKCFCLFHLIKHEHYVNYPAKNINFWMFHKMINRVGLYLCGEHNDHPFVSFCVSFWTRCSCWLICITNTFWLLYTHH
jgi:hypothetical protein